MAFFSKQQNLGTPTDFLKCILNMSSQTAMLQQSLEGNNNFQILRKRKALYRCGPCPQHSWCECHVAPANWMTLLGRDNLKDGLPQAGTPIMKVTSLKMGDGLNPVDWCQSGQYTVSNSPSTRLGCLGQCLLRCWSQEPSKLWIVRCHSLTFLRISQHNSLHVFTELR